MRTEAFLVLCQDVIETYGLIYNKALLNDYFETDGAVEV